jgi:hypothetical protein
VVSGQFHALAALLPGPIEQEAGILLFNAMYEVLKALLPSEQCLQVFVLKPGMRFSSLPCLLHAPAITSSMS